MNWMEPVAKGEARWGIAVLVFSAAYAVGCIASGYYLVRWKTGKDVRQSGSGGSGATNVGRILGRGGFSVTLGADLLKGITAIAVAREYGGGFFLCWLAMIAVVAGHIWPVQLGFQGGKGIAPLMGAVSIEDFRKVLMIAGLLGLAFIVIRRFSISGLVALTMLPLVLAVVHFPAEQVAGYALISILILWTHRQNLRDEFHRLRASLDVKPHEGGPAPKA